MTSTTINPWDRISLLNGQGWIELLDAMPNPGKGDQLNSTLMDMAVVTAARVSFLGDSKGLEQDKKLLFYLMRHHHSSPFEMCVFKMRIHCPVITMWHWIRYRAASYNSQSGRYTEFKENDFYIPQATEWRLQSASNKQASEGLATLEIGQELTDRFMKRIDQAYNDYTYALSQGIAREQARLFLHGWASMYTWIVKVDARNLLHMIQQRTAKDAQHEIRVYAQAIYSNIFKPLMPWTAEAFELYNSSE